MKRLATLSAAAILAGTSLAGAQTLFIVPQAPGEAPGIGSARPGAGMAAPVDRSSQRSVLREQMRREGFRDIRISDAMFVVRASTPDGREVVMVVQPLEDATQPLAGMPDVVSPRSRLAENPPNMAEPGSELAFEGRPETGPTVGVDSSMQRAGEGADMAAADQGRDLPERVNPNAGVAGIDAGAGPLPDPAMRDLPPPDEITGATGEADAAGDGGTPVMASEIVRTELRRRGFSDIGDWRLENGAYTGTADWYGEEVDLRVNARTGDVLQPSSMQPSQARRMLRSQGFTEIRNLRREGDVIRADASRDGVRYRIELDPWQDRIEDASREAG